MTLTVEECRIRDTAQLEELVAEMMSAVRRGDKTNIDTALGALTSFRIATPFAELQDGADAAATKATGDMVEAALGNLADIVTQISPAGEVFRSAARIAASGKSELLIPRLAASTAQCMELFTALQKATTTIAQNVGSTKTLKAVPQSVDAVRVALADLQTKIKAAANG